MIDFVSKNLSKRIPTVNTTLFKIFNIKDSSPRLSVIKLQAFRNCDILFGFYPQNNLIARLERKLHDKSF